jgi:hypothetical protein
MLQSKARLRASSATRWVLWRVKAKVHTPYVGAHFMLLGLTVVTSGDKRVKASSTGISAQPWRSCASAPGVQAQERRERYTSRKDTGVTRHAQNAKTDVSLSHLHHGIASAPWNTTTMETVLHLETTMKASPYRHN